MLFAQLVRGGGGGGVSPLLTGVDRGSWGGSWGETDSGVIHITILKIVYIMISAALSPFFL